MEQVQEQLSLLTSVQKCERNFKKDSASRKTEAYFQARLGTLTSFREEFRVNHRYLIKEENDLEVKKDYFEADVESKFEEAYIAAVSTIREAFAKAFPPPTSVLPTTSSNIVPPSAPKSEVALPEVKLPVFNGDYVAWPTFKEIFEARVHHSEQLNDAHKFYYLKGALSTEVAQDIEHLSLVAENYKTAWGMLKNIYDNKRLLFSHYMDAFDQQPPVPRNDAGMLKRFTQTCRSCVSSIQKLGVQIDQESNIFAYYMLKKLSPAVRIEIDRDLRKQKTIPTFAEVCGHLDELHRMMITSSNSQCTNKSLAAQDSQRKQEQVMASNKRFSKTFHVSKKSILCPICSKADHPVRECIVFQNMNLSDKRSAVDKHKLCFNCLGYNHTSSSCSSRRGCNLCGSRHHTLIHEDRTSNSPSITSMHIAKANAVVPPGGAIIRKAEAVSEKRSHYDVLLPTAIVSIKTVDGHPMTFRAFLDQGSQASFVTERTAQLLCLPRKKVHINISGLAEMRIGRGHTSVMLTLESPLNPEVNYKVHAYVLSKVSSVMPDRWLPYQDWKHLSGLKLADPRFSEPQQVDLLLGNDIYDEIILSQTYRAAIGEPIAQATTLGCIVSGKVFNPTPQAATNINTLKTRINVDEILQKFWELEEFSDINEESQQDQWCEEFYRQTHKRLENGRYLVRLPLLSINDPKLVIGASRQIALKRFIQLERRLQQDSSLKRVYQETIKEYLRMGQMKQAPTPQHHHQQRQVQQESQAADSLESAYTCCYLPHHPIVKESSSTAKVVVFEAAKTKNGKALNDILAVGPALQNDLPAVLSNWRLFEFAFMADVEKMYRCIAMNEEDAQYQRILWRDEPTEEIKELFCCTVMFGTGSAPFTAIRTMHQLAADEAKQYPMAVDVIKHQMYVDDILSGSDSIEGAMDLQQQVIGMLRSGGFELRKWASNHPRLLEHIPSEYQETKGLLHLNSSCTIKALGMYWNPVNDNFQFIINFEMPTGTPSKRSILSTIARLFDPLGWLNPVIITAKLIMQALWSHTLGWDDAIPQKIQKSWNQYLCELQQISKISVPRWLNTTISDRSSELHIFCDASTLAYSAVAYLRVLDSSGNYLTSILMAKSKVMPIKPKLTIPRAELCAAVLASKLFTYIKQHLRLNIDLPRTVFWTDSMIALGWIRGEPSRWKVFIANRTSKILAVSTKDQWRHVTTENNPADCSSRGLRAEKLSVWDLWWNGPKWLKEADTTWPESRIDDQSALISVENELKRCSVNFICIDKQFIAKVVGTSSSFSRLIRVIAYCKRFIFNCRRQRKDRWCTTLFVAELKQSLASVVRMVQMDAFPNEWKALSSNSALPENSPLLPLNPFYDQEQQVIRLGGRLRESLLSTDEKHPYILPQKHILTELVVKRSHLATLHGGATLTLNHIRKLFWIINGRNATRTLIHQCITCYKYKPKLSQQLMGDLPAERVRPARAFTSVGVDYAGPILILPSKGRGRTSVKGYIALFICLATKAVHLESVGDLSADSFIGALKRFIGRRGLCKDIFSDCGTNFVGANRKLRADRTA